jgi:hypothetical protein
MSLVEIYRISNYYCMVIVAESLTYSGPQLAVEPVAVAVATAFKTSITAAATAASATITVAVAGMDGNSYLRNRHNLDNHLHDGQDDVIVDKVEGAGTTMEQVVMSTTITSATKSSLREYYFEGVIRPLNKTLL